MSAGSNNDSDVVTLIYVPGQAGKIQRLNVPRRWIRQLSVAGIVLAVATVVLGVDYVRVRSQLTELDYLRSQTEVQGAQLHSYAEQVNEISDHLLQVAQLDRKLRVITNLDPAESLPLPGIGGVEDEFIRSDELPGMTREARHRRMTQSFARLAEASGAEAESLSTVLGHLENQQARLAATPSIRPTRGWVTSKFGNRSSPFTGGREMHRGLDIAGRKGTPVLSPADGVVRYAKEKRFLGKAISISHGYGIETKYGHLDELKVKPGQKVQRGELIGLMGNTGRSTGPHLHYQVEVAGKPVNPENYILN